MKPCVLHHTLWHTASTAFNAVQMAWGPLGSGVPRGGPEMAHRVLQLLHRHVLAAGQLDGDLEKHGERVYMFFHTTTVCIRHSVILYRMYNNDR